MYQCRHPVAGWDNIIDQLVSSALLDVSNGRDGLDVLNVVSLLNVYFYGKFRRHFSIFH